MKHKIPFIFLGVVVTAGILLAGGIFAFSASKDYTGVVTDTGNAPMSGVSVSDGRNVVKTDENGAFTLDGYRKTRFITMTVPAGYQTETYYIPVAKEISSYDFQLTKSENQGQAHSFLQISDSEIGKDGVGDWLNETKRLVNELKPDFLIHTGDLCYEDGLKQHIKDMNTETMGVAVKYIIGNHDYVDGEYGEKLYEDIYGPVWYSFEVGNVHYVITSIERGDYKSGYPKNDRWRWLENDLKNTDPDKKVIIFNHTDFPGEDDYVLDFDRKELDLKKHNLAAWIFGHYHYNFINERNGVLNISTARPDSGGIDQSAAASRYIKVDKDAKISTQLYYYPMDSKSISGDTSAWSTQLEGNVLFADTLTVGEQVFAATVDDDFPRDCGVYSLHADTGEILWSVKTKNSVKNSLVYNNNKIIAQDCQGNVYCINASDGRILWETEVALKEPRSTSIGITADGDKVFAGSGTVVSCLDINNGKLLWSSDMEGGDSSPARMQLSGDHLIVGSQWNALYALNKNTGKEVWKIDEAPLRFRSTTPNCDVEGKLYVAADTTLFILDAKTGETLTSKEIKGSNFDVSSRPLVAGNIAYFATSKGGIGAYDANTLEKLWDFNTKSALLYTAPYVGDGAATVESSIVLNGSNIVFGSNDGYVYTLDQKTGKLIQEINVGAPVTGAPAIYDNSIIVSDFSGKVSRFNQ